MDERLQFDPDNTLAGGLYAMTPKEAVALGAALCAAVELAVGADGCHCGVWPGNITAADGQVALGPANTAGIAEMSADMLEFVAPELFWDGKVSPAADVYSIGLVVYTALNRGVKPYFDSAEDTGAEARSKALEQRMRGENLPYPASAGRDLGEVVLKAVAYRAEERYETPGRLKAALESLPEGGLMPAVAPVVPLSEEELKTIHSYKVDKDFEPTEVNVAKKEKPRREKKARKGPDEVDEDMPAEAFRSGAKSKKQKKARPVNKTVPAATPEPPVEPAPETVSEKAPEAVPANAEKAARQETRRWLAPAIVVAAAVVLIVLLRSCGPTAPVPIETETPSPAVTTTPPADAPETAVSETAAPETEPPEESVQPSEAPQAGAVLSTADVSWTEAEALCEAQGGHLAVVRSAEDLNAVIALARRSGVQFLWLGAQRGEDGVWYNVTGEQTDYLLWDAGKPAGGDYLMLWYRPGADRWSYTDQVDDPAAVLPGSYAGRMGYICEFD